MFRGISPLNLDAKGRLAVPARYRDTLMQMCEGRLVITINHAERCLWMYPLEIWEEIERKLVKLSSLEPYAQRLKRLLIGHATDCETDANGRILIPPALRDYSALTKEVVLVGQGNKFEIWNDQLWRAQTEAELSQPLDGPLSSELETLSL